jgi:hypothetical protein
MKVQKEEADEKFGLQGQLEKRSRSAIFTFSPYLQKVKMTACRRASASIPISLR